MLGCFNITCFLCLIFLLVGLTSFVQLCLGIYTTFVETDITAINHLIKVDRYDSYLFYILLVFVGLGFISLILTLISIYGLSKRRRSLSLFVTILWVFTVILNLAICVISILYYYQILPQLPSLLLRSLRQYPLSTSNALDPLQTKYSCCGILNRDDYHNLALDPLPSSCCRSPNCWRRIDLNNNGSDSTVSFIHPNGCYPVVEKFVIMEIWIVFSAAIISAILQFLVIVFMCILCQRYRKVDDDAKFAINQLPITTPINENINNNNNNNNDHFDGSTQTLEETVEVTQI